MTAAVARLSAPAELVAVVPYLVGFVPTESVVLVALSGPRRRVRLTLRLDLPVPADADPVAASLVAQVRSLRAEALVALVYSNDPAWLARREIVDALAHHCDGAGLQLTEALLVRDGRFWSYTCSRPCCPPQGTPLPDGAGGPVGLVRAEAALRGRAVLADRAALEAALALPDDRALEEAFRQQERNRSWARMSRVERLSRWRRSVAAGPPSTPYLPTEAAQLALALQDVRVRDEVATWVLKQPERLLAVLHQLARQTPLAWDAPVCAVLAWTAYATGDGATANVALARALSSDPGYGLALLLREVLDRMLPPQQVRDLLRAAAAGHGDGDRRS